jgi:hypothetical protein
MRDELNISIQNGSHNVKLFCNKFFASAFQKNVCLKLPEQDTHFLKTHHGIIRIFLSATSVSRECVKVKEVLGYSRSYVTQNMYFPLSEK